MQFCRNLEYHFSLEVYLSKPCLYKIRLSILIRRTTHSLLEGSIEVLRILIPKLIGYFAHSLVGLYQQVFGCVDGLALNLFDGRFAGLFLDEVSEIIRR